MAPVGHSLAACRT